MKQTTKKLKSIPPNRLEYYLPPTLEVIHLEMEEGIASGSARLNPGNANSPDTPQVDDWNDGGRFGDKDYDL